MTTSRALIVLTLVLVTALAFLRPSGPNAQAAPKPPEAVELKAGQEVEFEIANGVTMRFCWIPAGKAQLGSPKAELDYISRTFWKGQRPDWLDEESESARGEYTSKGFWLGKYHVTQEEWKAVMGANPSYFDGWKDNKARGLDTTRFPVDTVKWQECRDFMKKLNDRSGAAKIFSQPGRFTLPHENEWEYACRGGKGNGRAFYFGDVLDGRQANCNGNRPYGTTEKGPFLDRTTKVGSYADKYPHPWGLCDMNGNVENWCENIHKTSEDLRVVRGGSWRSAAWTCRSAHHDWFVTVHYVRDFGCRVCFRLD